MSDVIIIPRLAMDDDADTPGQPGWAKVVIRGDDGETRPTKPIIRCNCGRWTGIALHHVHADGTVTASFFHSAEPYVWTHPDGTQRTSHDPDGCGWHVMIRLADYDLGEFPPHAE